MKDRLTLYRRHRQDATGNSLCSRKYKQDYRPFQASPILYDGGALRVEQPNPKNKSGQNLDCDCPIVADGALKDEPSRIRYRSVHNTPRESTTDWTTAVTIASDWIEQGYITPSVALKDFAPEPETETKDITVKHAIEGFLQSRNWDDEHWKKGNADEYTRAHYLSFFNGRVISFCENYMQNGKPRPIRLLTKLVDREFEEEFVRSWVRLARKKKDKLAGKPLTHKKKIYIMWRTFLGYCVNRDWLRKMPPKIDVKPNPDNPWRGLSPKEMQRVLAEAYKKRDVDPRAYVKQAAEIDILITELLMAHGVRISECVTLAKENIVPFEHATGHFLIEKIQWKHRTKQPLKAKMIVRSPISDEMVEKLFTYTDRYGYAGTDTGKRAYEVQGQDKDYHYFFWNPQTAKAQPRINYFGRKIREFIIRAQKPRIYEKDIHGATIKFGDFAEPFETPGASAHDFRHGFATNALAEGTFLLQDLSDLMGHGNINITEKYVHKNKDRLKYLGDVMARHNKQFGAKKPEPIKTTGKQTYLTESGAKRKQAYLKQRWDEFREKRVAKPNSKSGVYGVYPSRHRWMVMVTINGKSTYLGCYGTVKDAIVARDAALAKGNNGKAANTSRK